MNNVQNIFRTVGAKHGFVNVYAQYSKFSVLKLKWERSYKWASFWVSDFLKDAPNEVLEDIAETVFSKITGTPTDYSDKTKSYLLAPEFAKAHRPKFIARSRYLSDDSKGDCKDLSESIGRLVDAGLIPADHGCVAVWEDNPSNCRASCHSLLFRSIALNKALDSDSIPDFVIDYLVLVEIQNVLREAPLFSALTNYSEVSEVKPQYEKREEAESILRSLGLTL